MSKRSINNIQTVKRNCQRVVGKVRDRKLSFDFSQGMVFWKQRNNILSFIGIKCKRTMSGCGRANQPNLRNSILDIRNNKFAWNLIKVIIYFRVLCNKGIKKFVEKIRRVTSWNRNLQQFREAGFLIQQFIS